ncbi:hypothetical protein [Pseudoalteromonas spongiae]|uniref:Sulfotransferase family protein n=1 Tax=Pseudoalteromonas spongiae TaxID=298657 RepID=A0ABU8EQS7_9GAMM
MRNLLKSSILKVAHSAGYELKISRITKSQQQNRIAFIHLAKCGGISIDNAMRSQFAQSGERKIIRSPLIATSLYKFERSISNLTDACDFSELHIDTLQDALLYHLNQDWNYVSGHLAVNSKLLKHYSKKYDFITVLRNPKARFKSNYIFNKMTNNLSAMPPYANSMQDVINEANEIVYGRRGWQMANMQTSYITGYFPKDEHDAASQQILFRENIDQFKVVGILEELYKFKQACFERYKVKLDIKKRNQTDSNLTKEQSSIKMTLEDYFSSSKVENKLDSLCQFEMENYNYVKE